MVQIKSQKIYSHRDLIAWQKAMDLTVLIYDLTKHFPKEEIYRLTHQLSRAAVSVPANIAEGHERSTAKDYAQFLAIAKGSLMEAETFLMLAIRLNYLTDQQTQSTFELITEISKMISVLRKKLLYAS